MIKNIREAIEYFVHVKRANGARDILITNVVKGSWGIISQSITVDNREYMIFFKRDVFHTFGLMFGKHGKGQTFNMRALSCAVDWSRDCVLVVVMPNGEIHYARAFDVMEYIGCEDTIRTPSTEYDREGSVPLSMLTMSDPYETKEKDKEVEPIVLDSYNDV